MLSGSCIFIVIKQAIIFLLSFYNTLALKKIESPQLLHAWD